MLGNHVLLAATALVASVQSQYQGFNYGSNNADGSAAMQTDYENLFNAAQNLIGHTGFNSARLYTMIQSGTTNTPSSALPAAIGTRTSLLLGMWASAGQDAFNNELAALQTAIETYGSALQNLVVGISVGSEDLYRITPTGIANHAGAGAGPEVIASYIQQTRKVLANTDLSHIQVGHVDTWTGWVNGSNSAAIDACDWVGVDAYPYFQTVDHNSIQHGPRLFERAYHATIKAVGDKPVWITETGWPTTGPLSNKAVASVANARSYWDSIACKYLGKVNMWWYTLYDGDSSPSFGLTGTSLSTQPLFSLKCHNSKSEHVKSFHGSRHSSHHMKSEKLHHGHKTSQQNSTGSIKTASHTHVTAIPIGTSVVNYVSTITSYSTSTYLVVVNCTNCAARP